MIFQAIKVIFVKILIKMSASAIIHQQPIISTEKKIISWNEFKKRYLSREDAFKYEWVNGIAVKTRRSMDKSQFFIYENLLEIFDQLRFDKRINGRLISEGDTFFAGNHRRPDIAYFTHEQIRAAKEGHNIVPLFVIEVISTNDQMNLVHEKMEDYRNAEVPVVWHILPKRKEVHVYLYGKNMTICKGEEVCSAAPVLPDFNITVNQVFK